MQCLGEQVDLKHSFVSKRTIVFLFRLQDPTGYAVDAALVSNEKNICQTKDQTAPDA